MNLIQLLMGAGSTQRGVFVCLRIDFYIYIYTYVYTAWEDVRAVRIVRSALGFFGRVQLIQKMAHPNNPPSSPM